jgi:hypothetical protein
MTWPIVGLIVSHLVAVGLGTLLAGRSQYDAGYRDGSRGRP